MQTTVPSAPPEPGDSFAIQRAFAAHIRDPQANPAPAGIEQRRMDIYRELFYNNVSAFLENNFPVIRSLLGDQAWHDLVQDFFSRHHCTTPLFAEIPLEFIKFLKEQRDAPGDPPFLLELAHYEWAELALAIADQPLPFADPDGDLLARPPVLSPLAWNLAYRFPVHRIGPDFRPQEPPQQTTFLVVYRNDQDKVQFLEVTGMTHLLIATLVEHPDWSGQTLLQRFAEQVKAPDPAQLQVFGAQILRQLRERGIIMGSRRGGE